MKKKPTVDVESARAAKRDDYSGVLETIRAGGFCPFCEEHLFKHHRKPLLFKTKRWLVTENAWPYEGTKYHFLFIARPHVEEVADGPADLLKDLQVAYAKLRKRYDFKGATLAMRTGDSAYTGATVRHLHAQLIVGTKRTKASTPITVVAGYKRA